MLQAVNYYHKAPHLGYCSSPRSASVEAQHLLSNEYCFFDGMVKRCKNFVTITTSVYHQMLQKQLPLAKMECKSEDSANIGRFWNNFNKAFMDVTKTDKMLSPVGWITDMANNWWKKQQQQFRLTQFFFLKHVDDAFQAHLCLLSSHDSFHSSLFNLIILFPFKRHCQHLIINL